MLHSSRRADLRYKLALTLAVLLFAASCTIGDNSPSASAPPASPDATLTFAYGFAGDMTVTAPPTCAIHKHYQLLIQGTVGGHGYTISSTLPSFPTTSLIDIDGKNKTLFVVKDDANPAISWSTDKGAAGSVTINLDGTDGSVEAFLVKAATAPAETRSPLHVTGAWVCRAIG